MEVRDTSSQRIRGFQDLILSCAIIEYVVLIIPQAEGTIKVPKDKELAGGRHNGKESGGHVARKAGRTFGGQREKA